MFLFLSLYALFEEVVFRGKEMLDSRLIRFYREEVTDSEGRWIYEVWEQSDEWLESTHNFIQWLFPLMEGSLYNPDAPVLTVEDCEVFRGDADLRARMGRSLSRMLLFYGLELQDAGSGVLVVALAENFGQRRRNWLSPGNHNYLRLTRILKSLTCCGLRGEAIALLGALKKIYETDGKWIGDRPYQFWCGAVC
jgi:hypothetical protein